MADYDRVKLLADKAKEYERQRNELWGCYLAIDKADNKEIVLNLRAGIPEDLKVTLSNKQACSVVTYLCSWYKKEIDSIKEKIKECLTDSKEV